MSILLTGDESLTARLGRVGKVLRSLAQFRAAGLGTDVESMAEQFDTLRDVFAPVTTQQPTAKTAAGGLVSSLVACAQQTLLRMVKDDQPARSWNLTDAVAEVVRQFADQSETVSECATSAVATALTPFAGDGLVILTVRGRDGVPMENLFQETLWLTCIQDAQLGAVTRYQEQFRFRGAQAVADVWSDLWPAGSGGSVDMLAADPATFTAITGNQLTNSSFDDFTANVPDSWTIEAGSAGTQIIGPAAVSSYDAVGCLSLPGNATAAAISQTFGSGNNAQLATSSRYGVSIRTKVSAAPATGTLILEITNASNVVLTDPQGNSLRLTIDLTAETTSYAAHSAVWVTPRSLPVGAKFRVRVGTAIEVGKTAYADHLCFKPLIEAYPGGPAAAVISGIVPFFVGDGWTVDAQNDRASQDYGSTWQALMDRLFGMRTLALQLPSTSGAPSVDDTLITG